MRCPKCRSVTIKIKIKMEHRLKQTSMQLYCLICKKIVASFIVKDNYWIKKGK